MSKKEAKEQDKKKAKEPAKKPGRRKEKALPATVDSTPASPIEKAKKTNIEFVASPPSELVPYDENLLERSRTQWQFGDWESLAKLERDTLQHHPDRAKLALLAAAGHQQLGNMGAARQLTRLAQDWGCSKKLISQILIAGVHNTLGQAATLSGSQQRALQHFEKSICIGVPHGDISLLTKARVNLQLTQAQNQHKNLKQESPKETAPPQACKKPPQDSFSSDAKIDDFITDLAPFFHERAITYVDVGAFVGEVLLKIIKSKSIKIREAHLYEPNPESYAKLKHNIANINISSVHAYNFAIGNQPGEKLFSAARSMTKIIPMELEQSQASNIFTSECYSLDELAKTFTDNHVDLLKIDVEGTEIEALSGAKMLLTKQKIDVIYIEVGFNRDGTQQTYLAEIEKFLQDFGYRAFKIYEQTNEWTQDSPLLRRCNIAYMSSRFADANPYKATMEIYRLKKEISELKSRAN